jgi:large subunit ribosomal protein L11
MAKEVKRVIKLQITAGAANPSPPVGPALGQAGVNIMAFCKEFNATTQKQAGDLLPVIITVFKDSSFTFITKQPPATVLIKKACANQLGKNKRGKPKGSTEANKLKVANITKAQLLEIVDAKITDMNTDDREKAAKIIAGSCRQMGVTIDGSAIYEG